LVSHLLKQQHEKRPNRGAGHLVKSKQTILIVGRWQAVAATILEIRFSAIGRRMKDASNNRQNQARTAIFTVSGLLHSMK
jgi:hypothetical protein